MKRTGLLTPDDVAGVLQISVKTLANWRSSCQGPPYVKIGGLVRYDETKLETWIAKHGEEPVRG